MFLEVKMKLESVCGGVSACAFWFVRSRKSSNLGLSSAPKLVGPWVSPDFEELNRLPILFVLHPNTGLFLPPPPPPRPEPQKVMLFAQLLSGLWYLKAIKVMLRQV